MFDYRLDAVTRRGIIFVIIFGTVVLVATFLNLRWNHIYLNYQFNGRVDSVTYGDKGTPGVIIKGNEYYLDAGDWNENSSHLINKGDSLIKSKNSLVVTLIKPNGQIIIKGPHTNN